MMLCYDGDGNDDHDYQLLWSKTFTALGTQIYLERCLGGCSFWRLLIKIMIILIKSFCFLLNYNYNHDKNYDKTYDNLDRNCDNNDKNFDNLKIIKIKGRIRLVGRMQLLLSPDKNDQNNRLVFRRAGRGRLLSPSRPLWSGH